ncbi:unnamed protein product [Prorocentrum cordatum]|uniref:Uncharacterized protein n=1 Tax=Prorocentrum cordatum TaxID=2364126 RepID=A0ABN9UD83_9DINO|nr:unnamed protein product [Polarella glacialis]
MRGRAAVAAESLRTSTQCHHLQLWKQDVRERAAVAADSVRGGVTSYIARGSQVQRERQPEVEAPLQPDVITSSTLTSSCEIGRHPPQSEKQPDAISYRAGSRQKMKPRCSQTSSATAVGPACA